MESDVEAEIEAAQEALAEAELSEPDEDYKKRKRRRRMKVPYLKGVREQVHPLRTLPDKSPAPRTKRKRQILKTRDNGIRGINRNVYSSRCSTGAPRFIDLVYVKCTRLCDIADLLLASITQRAAGVRHQTFLSIVLDCQLSFSIVTVDR